MASSRRTDSGPIPKRALLVLLATLLTASACGGSDSGSEATLPPGATGTSSSEPATTGRPSPETTEQPRETGTPQTLAELGEGRPAVAELDALLPTAADDCQEAVANPSLLDRWADVTAAARDEYDDIDTLGDGFVQELFDRALGQRCDLPPGTLSDVEGTELTRLVGELDRFSVRTLGFIPFPYSPLWNVDELYGLLALSGNPEPEVAVIGSSIAAFGLDPERIDSRTGLTTVNLGVGGHFPEMIPGLLDELFAGEPPTQLVWAMSEVEYFTLCDPIRKAEQTHRLELRTGTFGGAPSGNSAPVALGLLQPDLEAYGESPLLSQAMARLDGNGPTRAADPDRTVDLQLRSYQSIEAGEICQERLDAAIGTLEELAGQGTRVTLALLPTADVLAESFPAGSDALTSAFAPHWERMGATGAQQVDLRALDQSLMEDLTHLTLEGRTVATDAVLDTLPDL